MKTTLKFLTWLVFLAMLVLPTSAAYAQGNGTDGGRVIFGSNFTLEEDDVFNGDLVVFGGNVTVEEGAELNGNLVVFGGTITSDGDVSGDVVIIGGQVKLNENAIVDGDLVMIGGQVDRDESAVVKGEVVNNVAPEIEIPNGRVPPDIEVPDVSTPRININYPNPFLQFFQVFFWAIVISAFAMLLTLFWQAPIERAGNTIVTQPLMTGAIGLVAVVVAILFAITILPPLIVAFAWLFGVVAMGREVGERFANAINQRWTPVATIGAGTFLLMLVGGALGSIPCLGPALLFVFGLLGVGGAISTWFNLQPALRPGVTVYTPPTDSSQIPPTS